ncbi:MAG: MBL fold metallo-hydrolase [Candidatus Omnitrophica bacterium]|nr:MBL fold metallo-hydrolase [Candidatus Omnitrophota bacterium]
MRLIIHRGAREIGGSCVELKTKNTRLLIDFGLPLVENDNKSFDLKAIIDKRIDGILISHSHLDHYGLLQYIDSNIPVYMSQGAKSLIDVSKLFLPVKIDNINAQVIGNKQPFQIGDFKITPYLVDHSAFDAFAFLIEAEGKRLFYSGDFRAHGRKAVLFKQLVDNPPKDIDCLLMEGSALGRDDAQYKTESEVEKRFIEILKERANITFLFASSQNIDRIVSAYRACLKADSIFVIDIYTAFILDKLSKVSKRIPQFNWKNIRVKFLKSHANALVKAGYRDLLFTYNKSKIDMIEINRNKNKILMLTRDNSVFPLIIKGIKGVTGARIAYSMWDGYLTEEFRKFCKSKGLNLEYIHTSGHATTEDLKTFAAALKPKHLIPIHTFDAEKYPKWFENVKILRDGEELVL